MELSAVDIDQEWGLALLLNTDQLITKFTEDYKIFEPSWYFQSYARIVDKSIREHVSPKDVLKCSLLSSIFSNSFQW